MVRVVLKSRTLLISTVTVAVLLILGFWWGFSSMVGGAPTSSHSSGELHFEFVSGNSAPATDGVANTMFLWGNGTFTSTSVTGGGTFLYWDNATAVPKLVLSTGTWNATEVLQWIPHPGTADVPSGTWGTVNSGIVDLKVDIFPDGGPAIRGATLRIICNVGGAGLVNNDPDTGEPLPEGFILTFPSTPFYPPPVGPFVPIQPEGVPWPLGLTVIAEGAVIR